MYSKCRVKVALVGDYSAAVTAHRAIPEALRLAGEALGVAVEYDWLATERILDDTILQAYDGIWCVPGSPYVATEGALRAICFAREQGVPFLGTCGGFQHALLEYARNQLGWQDAEHAELSSQTQNPLIAPLSCALLDVSEHVHLVSGSRIAELYGVREISEQYLCRYGLSDAFVEPLMAQALKASGHDEAGAVRAIELEDHPFFIATLFQPERAALQGRLPPLVAGLVGACAVQSVHEAQQEAVA
ncbi:Glutamine amidotransferase class-I [Pseudomonas sp. NFACC19-2]|uniref:CTP synthase C-terminal region-related (seleno)protein n=1 Tax=Ectopseudomonas toyotomiensis TaxID=554344 RepID=UPI0009087B2A|nr:CTP synthase [Pseudomonas sp. NFACC19-2]SFW42720.1 Glutamine amidotransferase class-I [Pseudomonas sp. NFACC19-2]